MADEPEVLGRVLGRDGRDRKAEAVADGLGDQAAEPSPM